MMVQNDEFMLITKKCEKISKPFIRACQKHGCGLSLIPIETSEPKNKYEQLYGQSEVTYGKEIELQGLLQPNPPEDFYKDNHLETRGDSVITLLTYQLQQVGFIEVGDLSAYQDIPKKLLGYHIRIGTDYYRIDEAKLDAIYQGFPLTVLLGLTYLKTVHKEQPQTPDEE